MQQGHRNDFVELSHVDVDEIFIIGVLRMADQIEAGMVYINLVLADSPELPFGGVKRSGIGRDLGFLGADEFVNKELIRSA